MCIEDKDNEERTNIHIHKQKKVNTTIQNNTGEDNKIRNNIKLKTK